VLERERRRLIDLAYRLLGSLAEAEDAVQETYTRWYAMSPQQQAAIASPAAWLTKVAGRVCLDLLGSARARRERYVGEWLPEPVPSAAAWTTGHGESMGDPADRVTLDESITMAFLVVLEAMTPAERVAFVLHDVFGYPFADVAEVVGRTPAACRQLASSARRRLRRWRRRPGTAHARGGRRRDRALLPRDCPPGHRPDAQRAHRERPTRARGRTRRPDRDGVRIRARSRPDQADLGGTQPGETAGLDGRRSLMTAATTGRP